MSSETLAEALIPAAGAAAAGQDALYERVNADLGAALVRLARAHEADPSLQQDLLQEIHIAIWRSLAAFAGRCSLRTWVYRVAHNAAATWVLRHRRRLVKDPVSLDDLEIPAESVAIDVAVDEARMLARLRALLPQLKPIDREVFVLHLEGLSVEEVAEITGLSHSNTGVKIHRIRALLTAELRSGESA